MVSSSSGSNEDFPVPAKFIILDGKNYIWWAFQMKMHFFLQDLLEVVKKGVPNLKKGASDAQKAAHKETERKDSTALYLIRESVNFEAFLKIATAETAKDAWEILEESYYDNGSRDTSMVPEEPIEEIGQNFGITNMSPDEPIPSNCLEIEKNTSMVPKETNEVIAQNIGINKLSPDESIQSNCLEIERESIVPKETIEVIAQTLGITNLSPNVALALAPNLEYHIRKIMQESIKCMRHSMRTFLTADDIDTALAFRNYKISCLTFHVFAWFKRAAEHKDLLYVNDKAVDLKDLVEVALPKAPLDTSIASHWLAIEGVQPAIPANAPVELEAPGEIRRISENTEDGLSVDLNLPVKHVIRRDLQLYYEKITELCLNKAGSIPFRKALVNLATDPGLHPLAPYVTCFIAEEVARSLNNLNILFALMRVVRSLVQNPHIHIEPYIWAYVSRSSVGCDENIYSFFLGPYKSSASTLWCN